MYCRAAALAALFLLLPSLIPTTRAQGAPDDMMKVQGRWERDLFGPAGQRSGRAVKEITGNHETITLYDLEDRITHRHKVEFKLETAGPVKLFTFTNLEVTDGADKGRKTPGPISYIYRVDANQFVEAWGFLPGQETHPAEMFTWSRGKPSAAAPPPSKPNRD